MPQSIPSSIIEEDQRLERSSDRATEKLAKHRWHNTLDPAGPQHSINAYASAVGRAYNTVYRHAKGYEMFLARQGQENELSLEDSFRLVGQSADQQRFSEAIAAGSGEPVGRVARGDNASRRGAIIEQARQRAERRGTDPVDEAREIATRQRQTREMATRRRAERASARSLRYVSVEGHLAGAQRRLRQAMDEAVGVDFNDEEMELLRSTLDQIKALLRLLDMRMAGQVDVDWDAELAGLNGGAS